MFLCFMRLCAHNSACVIRTAVESFFCLRSTSAVFYLRPSRVLSDGRRCVFTCLDVAGFLCCLFTRIHTIPGIDVY